MEDMRIVLLGKTGDGKSSSANTILGEIFFDVCNGPGAVTNQCGSKTKIINGRKIKVVDTPGFFDICRPEDVIKKEIIRCITECSPGPHAFVYVLKAERYSLQEMEVVNKITETFGEDALKYTVVLFTRGDQLNEGQTIEQYVDKVNELRQLVQKCGGRSHVIDNKYWNTNQNNVQVEKLLNSIDEMVRQNGGGYYTNEMLQAVEDTIQAEMKDISLENANGDSIVQDVRQEAVNRVTHKFLITSAGVAAGACVGAFLGAALPAVLAILVGIAIRETGITGKTVVGLAKSAVKEPAVATTAGAVLTIGAVGGAIGGGIVGAQAVGDSKTTGEAARRAVEANMANAKKVVDCAKSLKDNYTKQGYKKVESESDD